MSASAPPPASQPPVNQAVATPDAVRQQVDRLTGEVRSLRWLAAVAIVAAIVAVVMSGIAFTRPAASTTTTTAAPATTGGAPTASPADAGPVPAGTVVLGPTGQGLPVVDVYEDYQCPACAQVQPYVAADLAALAEAREAELRFHLMSFLDDMLGNDASARAAAGAFCAHEQGRFLAWHDAVWANHPANEGDGWTDVQLAAIATAAGLEVTAWGECTASGRYAGDVRNANETSFAAGVSGTPTFRLNGAKLDLNQVMAGGGLRAWVQANG